MHPIVAIVGRPNVGKSRLFNRIVGGRRAIVADVPGFTRDRHYAPAEWEGLQFIAVDTGGLDPDADADLSSAVSKQSLRAIDEADVVVCIFDGKSGPTETDREVSAILRRSPKPVVYAVNKIDEEIHEGAVTAYHEFGVPAVVAISAEHGRGVDDLLDEVIKRLPIPTETKAPETCGETVAVIGRPNVGKSTLVNRLAGEERVVAHELPGTTRDAIDVEIDFDGKRYVFIDTAGIRRHWNTAGRLERFTTLKTIKTIDRAAIVCLLIDGLEGIARQDLHLAGFAREEGKGLIVLVNKWDKVETKWEVYKEGIQNALGRESGTPIYPVSALTGMNCLKIFSAINRIGRAIDARVPTARLNRIVQEALARHHLPSYRGKQVRIYYATQVGTRPPTFALFSNYPAAVPYAYRRYLMHCLQDSIGVKEVPVRIVCRRK